MAAKASKNATDNKVLQALYKYYLNGTAKGSGATRQRIHEWRHKHSEIAEKAKELADTETLASLTEIRQLCFKHQIRNLEFTTKNKIAPETINRILGTTIDKELMVQGKHPDQADRPFNLIILWEDPNAPDNCKG